MADPNTGSFRPADQPVDNPSGRAGHDRPGRQDPSTGRTREVLDDAKQQATSLAREAKEQGKNILAQQKTGAAEQVGSVAGALHSAADDLQRRDQLQAGRFVAYAAEQLESFGRRMRDQDVDSLISDAEHMGRQSPAAFFAGSVAVGFLLTRFLKSSARTRQHQSDRTPSTAPPTGDWPQTSVSPPDRGGFQDSRLNSGTKPGPAGSPTSSPGLAAPGLAPYGRP